jgi:hypothetical protein
MFNSACPRIEDVIALILVWLPARSRACPSSRASTRREYRAMQTVAASNPDKRTSAEHRAWRSAKSPLTLAEKDVIFRVFYGRPAEW